MTDLDRIRQALPVERVLTLYGVTVNRNRARCPLAGPCTDKYGQALAIYRDGQAWRCHRCSRGGSVLDLLAALENSSLGDAIRRAASLIGLEPGEATPSRAQWHPDPAKLRRRILGEQFLTIAAVRDILRRIADDSRQAIEMRANALAGVVACNRKLDLILEGNTVGADDLRATKVES